MKKQPMLQKSGKLILLILILSASLQTITAIGVTPGKKTISYTQNAISDSFTLLNSDHRKSFITITPRGELANFISVSEAGFSFLPIDESHVISFSLYLPSSLSPGTHTAELVIVEQPDAESGISSLTSVIAQIEVIVPYAGTFAEVSLDISTKKKNQIEFFTTIDNRGTEAIHTVEVYLDITDNNDSLVTTLKSSTSNIPVKTRSDLHMAWNPTTTGEFKAKANVIYDEKRTTLEKTFEVGELLLGITDIELLPFTYGENTRVRVTLENADNKEITDVKITLQVMDGEERVLQQDSLPSSLSPYEKKAFDIYFDSGILKKKEYFGAFVLSYNGKSVKKDIRCIIEDQTFTITMDNSRYTSPPKTSLIASTSRATYLFFYKNALTIVIIILIIIFLNINIFLYMWFIRIPQQRKKEDKKTMEQDLRELIMVHRKKGYADHHLSAILYEMGIPQKRINNLLASVKKDSSPLLKHHKVQQHALEKPIKKPMEEINEIELLRKSFRDRGFKDEHITSVLTRMGYPTKEDRSSKKEGTRTEDSRDEGIKNKDAGIEALIEESRRKGHSDERIKAILKHAGIPERRYLPYFRKRSTFEKGR